MEYVTAKTITIPAGTRLRYPEPTQKEAVTYGHAAVQIGQKANVCEHGEGPVYHFAIPLDEALKEGLVEEVK